MTEQPIRGIKDPRVGYKTATVEKVEKTQFTTITRTEHFDGTLDATVAVKAMRLSFAEGADPNREHVAAIAELQAATQEHRLARHSGLADWVRYTTERLHRANDRLLEVQ